MAYYLLTLLIFLIFCSTVAADTSAFAGGSGNVAKVGNTEYANLDEAIAAWTNGATLTLLADVTLSDAIILKSTEYHILDLGTYTMTAASKKDAIRIENCGRSSASYTLDIKADASNPGGIIATGKAIVCTSGKSGVKDRPIIRFYGGIFNATNIVAHSGSSGTNCPQFYFYGGDFTGTISTNRALMQFYGGTFHKSLFMSVDSSAYALISGGTFKQLSNLYMSALNANKFTIGSAKGTYDRDVYVDDNGYYVIATAVPAEGIEAAVSMSPTANDYFCYSKIKSEGKMGYTDAYVALTNNVNASVFIYVDALDLTNTVFKGTLWLPEADSTLIVMLPEGAAPAWKVGPAPDLIGKIAYYTVESVSGGIETREYALTDGYTVTLNTDGGTIIDGRSVTYYLCGEVTTLPSSEDISKTGHTFEGWYEETDFSGTAVTEISAEEIGDKVYYAKWSANTYAVTLNTDDGTIADGKDVTGYTYGAAASLPGATDITKVGHTFEGWYESEDFIGDVVTEISAGEIGDKIYYAKWNNMYTVTLNADGGTIADGKDVTGYTYGSGAALPDVREMSKDGYGFAGWYESADFIGEAVTAISESDSGDKIYYAKWVPKSGATGTASVIPAAPIQSNNDTPTLPEQSGRTEPFATDAPQLNDEDRNMPDASEPSDTEKGETSGDGFKNDVSAIRGYLIAAALVILAAVGAVTYGFMRKSR